MKIKINDKVYLVRGEKPTRFPYCNCLLVEDKTRAIIETGTELDVLQEVAPESIDVVINSHAHLDHMHGNWAFTNARIGFHPETAALAQFKELYADSYVLNLWQRLMSVPLNLKIQFDRPHDVLEFKDTKIIQFPATRVDFTFKDGDEIDFGRVKLKVIHAPGHCRGHCCFLWEKEGILFSSDIDFTGAGPWYGNDSADLEDFIVSIRRLVDLSPHITVPAHGRMIEGSLAKPAETYIDHIYRRDEKILKMLSQPRTLDDLGNLNINIFQESSLHPIFKFWDKVGIHKHLARLVCLGEVKQEGNTYFKT